MSKKNKQKTPGQIASQLSAQERTKLLVKQMQEKQATDEATSIVSLAEQHRDEVEAELETKKKELDDREAGIQELYDSAKDDAKVEAQKIIDEAKAKAKTIEEEASAKAESIVNSSSDMIERKISEGIVDKTRELNETIELKKKALEKENESLVSGLKEQKEMAEALSADLEKKLHDFLIDSQKLEQDKLTYKETIEAEFKDGINKIEAERDELLKKINESESKIKKLESANNSLVSDQEFYETQLSEFNDVKKKLTELEYNIEDWKTKYATLDGIYKKDLEEKAELNAQVLQFGNDPQKSFKKIKELEEELSKFKDQLADCPNVEELATLRDKAVKYEEAINRIKILTNEKNKLEYENTDLKGNQSDLENSRRIIKILELQKAELERELDRTREMYEKRSEKIFANLSEIDKKPQTSYQSSSRITLFDLCENFRAYLQTRPKNRLFYDADKIRTFIAGFASSRLTILEGLSGTGKTWLPRAFMQFITQESDDIKALEIPVQSSWKDRNDLLGFYNDFKKQYKETEFLKALYTAVRNPNTIYLIVLDEMNLSRIEYYFADILSVMEKPESQWSIELISDYASLDQSEDAWPKAIHEGRIQILNNVWFIGTANKDDSTFLISDKVYDRSTVIEFSQKGLKDVNLKPTKPMLLNNSDFINMLDDAVSAYPASEHKAYKEMMDELDGMVLSYFSVTFGNRIQNQLERFVPVYVECGGTKEEAIDIVFSKKVLRKLEDRYDQSTKDGLDMLLEDIQKKYPNKLPRTEEVIKKMKDRI